MTRQRLWTGLIHAALVLALGACAPEHAETPDWCGAVASQRGSVVTTHGCAGCDNRCWLNEDTPASAADVITTPGPTQTGDDVAYSGADGGVIIEGVTAGLDTDGDGLPDITDPTPADPNGDADGDGVPDAWEVYLGRSPTTADPPPPTDELYAVLPYEGGPVTYVIPPDLPIQLRSADIFFLVDTSWSMGGEIANLQSSITSTIIPSVQTDIDDPQFGVGQFRDFASSPPLPYETVQEITSDGLAVESAIMGLTNSFAYPDWAESQTAALHAIATGQATACGPGAATCPAGHYGHPCFRPDAVPIIVVITDADFHNGVWDTLDPPVWSSSDTCYELSPGCDSYSACFPLSPACPSLETVVGELNAVGAKVIGVWSGSWPGDLGHVSTWGWGRTYPDFDEVLDLYYTVDQTGSEDGSGVPFVYGIDTDGSGLGTEIAGAIGDLVATMLMDVSALWYDADPLAPDTTVLVEDIDPVACTMCTALDTATNTAFGVSPGSTVTFELTMSNDTGEIPATPDAQVVEVTVQITDGTSVLAERLVHVLVPGTDVDVPAIEGRYWHDYDALNTCTALQTPMWSRIYPDATIPTGTAITYSVRTSSSAAGLDVAPAVEVDVPVPDLTGDVHQALLDAGQPPSARFLRVEAFLRTNTGGVSPVLHSLFLEHYCL